MAIRTVRRNLPILLALVLFGALSVPAVLSNTAAGAVTASDEPGITSTEVDPEVTETLDEVGFARVIVVFEPYVEPEPSSLASALAGQPATIEEAQTEVVETVEDAGPSPQFEVNAEFEVTPAMAVTVDAKDLEAIAALPFVKRIVPDRLFAPTMFDSGAIVGADPLIAEGYTGTGAIAIIDTGIQSNHPMFVDDGVSKVIAEACFSSTFEGDGFTYESLCPGGVTQSATVGSGADCVPDVAFGCGHGTHVAGIAAGYPWTTSLPEFESGVTLTGIAPGAQLIAVNVFSKVEGAAACGDGREVCVLASLSDTVKGLEFVFALATRDVAPVDVAAVNMSLGGDKYTEACAEDLTGPSIAALVAAGIPVFVASGNDFWSDAINAPACVPGATVVSSIAKYDPDDPADLPVVSWFANTHPSLVDIYAPGSGGLCKIVSALPMDTAACFNGTSMATPMVAGAWSLVRNVHPTESYAQLMTRLLSTPISASSRESAPEGRDDGEAVNFSRPVLRLAAVDPTPTPTTVPRPDPVPPASGGMETIDPQRVIDTRATGPVTGGQVLSVQLSPPPGATGAVLNVTAVGAAPTRSSDQLVTSNAAGFATVYACGQERPNASNLNFTAGTAIPNAVITGIGANGRVCVFVSETTNVLVDVTGWFTEGFTQVAPARLLETRQSGGLPGRVAPGSVTRVRATGVAGVPASARGVALNITAVNAAGSGFLSVYPCEATRPDTSSVNFTAGVTVANLVVTAANPGGEVCVYSSASTDVLIDVFGWFTTVFQPVANTRLLDTRPSSGPVSAGSTTRLRIAGAGPMPARARSVAAAVTAVNPKATGFVTVYPCDQTRPNTSNSNPTAGTSVAKSVYIGLSATGELCIYSSVATDLLVDVSGWFGGSSVRSG